MRQDILVETGYIEEEGVRRAAEQVLEYGQHLLQSQKSFKLILQFMSTTACSITGVNASYFLDVLASPVLLVSLISLVTRVSLISVLQLVSQSNPHSLTSRRN